MSTAPVPHDCHTHARPAGRRCPACRAHVYHCALCSEALTDHRFDPCPGRTPR